MKNTPSEVIVYFSEKYDLFEFIHGNRILNEDKIKKIIREIESGNDMLKYYPIQVKENPGTGKLAIIDGQHRYTICQRLKRCIYYIIVKEEKTIVDIARVNTNVEKWKSNDFLESYISNGNEDYARLKEFIAEYPLSIGFAACILMNGSTTVKSRGKATLQFQSGSFKINFYPYATKLATCCSLFHNFPLRYQRAFVEAIDRIVNCGLVPIEELAERVTAKIDLLSDQGNYKNYIYKLEEIYNIGKHSRTIIYAKPEPPKKEVKREAPKKELKPKIVTPVRPNYQANRRMIDHQPKFKTKENPLAGKVLLKIDAKTSIYIPANANPEIERQKYLKNRKGKLDD